MPVVRIGFGHTIFALKPGEEHRNMPSKFPENVHFYS